MVDAAKLAAVGAFSIEVQNPDGQISAAVQFRVMDPPPVITGMDRTSIVVGAGQFTLTGTQPGLTVLQASPTTVGNTGSATLTISGVDFQPTTTFTLSGPSGNVLATATQFVNAALVYVTFNLTGVLSGAYGIMAMDGDGTNTTLANAVQVQAGVGGKIQTSLVAPSVVRSGRVQEMFVNYQNVGDADDQAHGPVARPPRPKRSRRRRPRCRSPRARL